MSRKTRKLIWSAPLVAVLAVAGALAMFAAQGTGSVFANPLPGVPMNVEANPASGNAGRTTLVVKWDPVADADGYRIDVSDDSFVWETRVTADDPHTSTTYTDSTDLTASDVRWYRIFAVNDHGEGPVSDPDDGMTSPKGKPGPVRNFTATAMGQRQINLTWDPPADDGGEKISAYEIQYHNGTDWVALLAEVNGSPPTTTDYLVVTEETRMDDGGFQDKDTDDLSLDPGEMRRYQIRAVNQADTTEDVTADDRTDAEAPGTEDGWVRDDATTAVATGPTPPSGLTAVNTTTAAGDTGTISLHWFAPELMNNGGWPVTDYLVQVRRVGEDWLDIPNATALAALGDTSQTGVTIADDGNANFKIPVGSTNGATQMSFTGVPNTWDHDTDTDTDEEPLWLEFQVFAISTDDGADDDPDAALDNMVIIGTSASETSVRVRTVARPTSDAADDDQTVDADPYAQPTLRVTGAGGGNAPTANGDAMEELIELEITSPTGVGKQNIYRIDYSDDGGNTWKLREPRTTFTEFDINRRYQDHTAGYDASRTYRVFALRSNWRTTAGPVSAAITGTTTASEAPGAVTGLTASAPDLETIMASWTAPSDDGGQPVVKYLYQYVRDDDDDVPDENDWTTTNPHVTVEATDIPSGFTDDASTMAEIEATLVDNVMYHIRVAAVNKNPASTPPNADRPTGVGDTTDVPKWSNVYSFTSGDAAAPNMVEGIASEMAKDGTGTRTQRGVDVLWNEPTAGATATHYVIERSKDMGETWESPTADAKNSPVSSTAYTDPDHYVAGETLVYRVRAANDAGMSDPVMVYYPRDPASDHSHEPTPLIAPDSVMATIDDTDPRLDDVIVTWTGGSGPEGTKVAIGLFTRDFGTFFTERVVNDAMGGMAKFDDLPDGEYVFVVATYHPDAPTVGESTRSNVIVVPGN